MTKTTRLDVVYETETVSLYPVQEDEWTNYYFILYDFQVKKYYRPDLGYSVPRSLFDPNDELRDTQGYPGSCRLKSKSGAGTPFTEELQWFDFNLCMLSQYGFIYGSVGWMNLTTEQKKKAVSEWGTYHDSKRVLNNKAGVDVRANYVAEKILKEPLKSGLPLQMNVVMIGNVVKALRNEVDIIGGEPCLEIEVWDGKNPPPDPFTFNWATHKHLIHFATNSTPFAFDGKTVIIPPRPPWRVDAFSFFGGRGSPYAVLSHERQWIPRNRVRRLKKSELFPKIYSP